MNPSRRKLLASGAALPFVMLSGCVSNPSKPPPIEVDLSTVSDVPTLITSMKRSAGGLLSNSVKDTDFLNEFARIFVENAHAAAEKGMQIPQWVLDKLPKRKTVVPIVVGALPFFGVASFAVGGVGFVIPIAAIILVVLASIVLMGSAILAAINVLLTAGAKT